MARSAFSFGLCILEKYGTLIPDGPRSSSSEQYDCSAATRFIEMYILGMVSKIQNRHLY